VQRRRVAVTGLGLVCPVGNTVEEAWSNLVAGKPGIGPITRFDAAAFACRIAGEVKGFDVAAYLPAKEARHMDTFIHYGLAAAIQAWKDCGLQVTEANAGRIGVNIGSGIGGLPRIEETHGEVVQRGPRRISPFFVPATIINMISGHLSILYGMKGPNLAVVTACTTGLHAIGLSARLIEYGDADVMLAGGAEATISPLGVGGFAAARALSTRNDDPATASRPWDKDRDGFVLGEGGGVLVLEEFERAKARGARIYCELLGFGMSADAFHMTAPDLDGPRRSMLAALANARLPVFGRPATPVAAAACRSNAAEHQRAVGAAKAEVVLDGVVDPEVPRRVGAVVQVALRILVEDVDRRRGHLALHRQRREHRLDAARPAQQMAGHRLGGIHHQLRRVGAEG